MLVPETPPAISSRICSSEVEVRNCLALRVGARAAGGGAAVAGGAVVGEQPVPKTRVGGLLLAGGVGSQGRLPDAVEDEPEDQDHHEDQAPGVVAVEAALQPVRVRRRPAWGRRGAWSAPGAGGAERRGEEVLGAAVGAGEELGRCRPPARRCRVGARSGPCRGVLVLGCTRRRGRTPSRGRGIRTAPSSGRTARGSQGGGSAGRGRRTGRRRWRATAGPR